MIYYINVNKKRIVGRNNQISTRPLNLEYNTIEHLEFQFITDNNQIVELGNLSGLALAIGLKQNKPSYDLLALSRDYTIEDNILKFNLNCYTVNWLREVNKNNTEAYIEISQESLEAKQVMLRDYCYVWPRTLIDGLTPEEIQSNNYYTKIETDQAIQAAISGIVPPSGDYATEEYVDNAVSGLASQEYVDTGLEGKQSLINDENKLAYDLLSGTPTIPTKTSDLTNDSEFVTLTDVEDAISGKQDIIDAENKLDYGLVSGTPTVPTSTSQLTNDSGFVDGPELETALTAKQDVIDAENKLDYSLLSGTPSIPLSTSELVNDSDFTTSGYVNTQVTAATSGKLDKADYVAPYKLPYVGVEQGEDWWQEEGFENPWTDMDIIPNNKKIKVVPKGNDDILVFPTLYSDINENTVRTCEIWIKLAGNAATGAEAIEVPSSYFIVDEDNFPTSLKGEATANESYTYHVFVIRAVPRQGTGTSLCEICYSHFANSNISL